MIRYLKTFIAAAQASSFSQAGAQIGLTQSAVSMQIKRLEDELKCELFERTGKAVTLNEQGSAMLEKAQQIVALFESMQTHSQSFPAHGTTPATLRGRIEIGAISTVQLGLLPTALASFREQFPHMEVNVVPGTSVQLMAQIDSSELSLAVMIKPQLRMGKGLAWNCLLHEPYVAIAPHTSTETTLRTLLAAHPFLRYSRRSYGGQLVDRYLKRHRLPVHDTMELDEPMVILEMARKGLGVGIIPYSLLAAGPDQQRRILALDEGPLTREIGILQRTSTTPSIAAQALIANLKQQATLLTT